MTSKTISKNRSAYINDLFSRATNVQGRDLASGFAAWDTTAEYVKSELFGFNRAKLVDCGDGTYQVNIHSNLWYRFQA